jgi:hypothetical protein
MKTNNTNEGDIFEAVWSVISLAMGQATAFLGLYPTLQDVPGFTREGLTFGFGFILGAIYFLMGMPCVFFIRKAWNWSKEKYDGVSKVFAKKS